MSVDPRLLDPLPGRTYRWRGQTWRVVCRAAGWTSGPSRSVLIEDTSTGERVVRPFRGLRRVRD